jgi:hypothetical protein
MDGSPLEKEALALLDSVGRLRDAASIAPFCALMARAALPAEREMLLVVVSLSASLPLLLVELVRAGAAKVLRSWLREATKGGAEPRYVVALLDSLNVLPIDKHILQSSELGKTVASLTRHRSTNPGVLLAAHAQCKCVHDERGRRGRAGGVDAGWCGERVARHAHVLLNARARPHAAAAAARRPPRVTSWQCSDVSAMCAGAVPSLRRARAAPRSASSWPTNLRNGAGHSAPAAPSACPARSSAAETRSLSLLLSLPCV